MLGTGLEGGDNTTQASPGSAVLTPYVASAGCDGWPGLIPACTAGASPLPLPPPPEPQLCSCQKQHVGSIIPGGRVSVTPTPTRREKGLKGRELPKKLFGGVLITAMSLSGAAEPGFS